MPPALIALRVPGKLMIAGEYAVLEPRHPAVVVAVDRHVTATLARLDAGPSRLSIPGFGIAEATFEATAQGIAFTRPDPRLRFVAEALAVTLPDHLDAPPFHLTLVSDLEDGAGRKFGLGGSAAATVAAVAAIETWLAPAGEAPAPTRLFKLAAVAHFRAQGGGSGADIAASVFGGWLRYTSFGPAWMAERLARGTPLSELVAAPWPFYTAEHLSPLPRDLCLCIGWTGEPVSTQGMLDRVLALRDSHSAIYGHFLAESLGAVDHLVAGLTSANPGRALAAIERNRAALIALGETAGVAIETPPLAALAREAAACGGGGKPSGAGGGDCGVALVFGAERRVALEARWRTIGLEPLSIGVDEAGITSIRWEL